MVISSYEEFIPPYNPNQVPWIVYVESIGSIEFTATNELRAREKSIALRNFLNLNYYSGVKRFECRGLYGGLSVRYLGL